MAAAPVVTAGVDVQKGHMAVAFAEFSVPSALIVPARLSGVCTRMLIDEVDDCPGFAPIDLSFRRQRLAIRRRTYEAA